MATKTAQGGPPLRSKNGPRAPEHDPKTAPSGPQSFQGSPNRNIPKRPLHSKSAHFIVNIPPTPALNNSKGPQNPQQEEAVDTSEKQTNIN